MSETKPMAGAIAGLLVIPQALVAAAVVFLAYFQGMSAAGCAQACDYEVAGAAQWVLLAVVVVIFAATLAVLLILRRREWRNWPIALVSVLATVGASAVASHVLGVALVRDVRRAVARCL